MSSCCYYALLYTRLVCLRLRRVLMSGIPRMAAAFIRLVTTFGLLLLIIGLAWTTLFLSARFTHRLVDTSVYSAVDHVADDNNRTRGKFSSWRLLEAGTDGLFHLNGRPKRLISGEMHYFRVHPAQWEERLRRMRTAGLNTITTRVPWNLHEPHQSKIQFHGLWNLPEFIRLVHRLGFLLIVNVGPYIDADWDLGGLPSWLLSDRRMTVRSSSNPAFLEHVSRYFSHLLPIIERSTYRRARGPIIAVQIESEYGSYNGHQEEDTDYMRELVKLIRAHGIRELILTSDRGSRFHQGSVPGTLATVSCHTSPGEVTSALSELAAFQPDLPRFVTLLDLNGTSRWGETTAVKSVDGFCRAVDLVLRANASINVYAFSGGTNFGLWSGALEATDDGGGQFVVQQAVYRRRKHHRPHRRMRPPHLHHNAAVEPVINVTIVTIGTTTDPTQASAMQLVYRPATTAYNYSPPPIISQSGHSQFSLKFHAFRRLLLDRRLISRLQTVPANPGTSAVGVVRLDHQLAWQNLLDLSPPITLDSPVFMEHLGSKGQDHGWVVYRSRLPAEVLEGSILNISGTIRDRVQVFVNGRHLQTVYVNKLSPAGSLNILVNLQHAAAAIHHHKSTSSPAESSTSLLELVVENMGRCSFGLLDEQRKGFEGSLSVEGKPLESTRWQHYSIDFSARFITAARDSRAWVPTVRPLTLPHRGQPTLYRGHFRVKQLKDTFIDMTKWTKGLVVVNGFVLGRYWNVGPQQSLYVPSPILQHGVNELLVFELERTLNGKVKFVGKSTWTNHRHRPTS